MEDRYVVLHDSLERRKHHQITSCYLAKHRDTIYKDIPINQLIPLAFHVKVSHLKTVDLHQLITSVCKIYDNDNSDLFNDWQKYCRNLDSEQRVIATLEGALYFAAKDIPASKDRESWISSCISDFHSLKHGTNVGSEVERPHRDSEEGSHNGVPKTHPVEGSGIGTDFRDSPSVGSLSRTQINSLPVQQEASTGAFHDTHFVLSPANYTYTEFPPLPVTTIAKNVLGDFLYNDVTETMQMHMPRYLGEDWILEIAMSLPAGQAVMKAKNGSIDGLKSALGVFIFEAMRTSKLVEEGEITNAVAIHGVDGNHCGLLVTIGSATGMYMMNHYCT